MGSTKLPFAMGFILKTFSQELVYRSGFDLFGGINGTSKEEFVLAITTAVWPKNIKVCFVPLVYVKYGYVYKVYKTRRAAERKANQLVAKHAQNLEDLVEFIITIEEFKSVR